LWWWETTLNFLHGRIKWETTVGVQGAVIAVKEDTQGIIVQRLRTVQSKVPNIASESSKLRRML